MVCMCVFVRIVREKKRGWGSDKGMSGWNEWRLNLPINKQLGPVPWGLHASLQMQLHKKDTSGSQIVTECASVRACTCNLALLPTRIKLSDIDSSNHWWPKWREKIKSASNKVWSQTHTEANVHCRASLDEELHLSQSRSSSYLKC